METAVVAIICMALVITGGMMLTQSFLATADATNVSVERLSVRQGEIMRTGITITSASVDADQLDVRLDNSGQTKLASFDKWDIIVHYYDDSGYNIERLDYTAGSPSPSQWQKTGIYVEDSAEGFEPDILNPGEELRLSALLEFEVTADTNFDISVVTPNGVTDAMSFTAG